MGIKWVSKKTKKSMSKKIVPLVLICIFVFTGIAIYVQVRTGMELSPTLITCFFSFCTGELWCLSSIKKMKLKQSHGYKVSDKDKHTIGEIISVSDEADENNEGAKG